MRRPLVASAGVLAWSPSALACAVCGPANEATANAFLGSTIFLSLLPLCLIFGGFGMLWYYSKHQTVVPPAPVK